MKITSQQSPEHEQQLVRLNKFLADAGIASRRKADELIARGVVKVNGRIVTELGTKVHPGDLVTVEGKPVSPYKHLTYIVLNKPKDYITTTSDERGRKTVLDLVPLKTRLYPVGRLDRNTTGVLLLTNDGELAARLTHPRYGVEREYIVGLDKPLEARHAAEIARGVRLDDETTGPAEVIISPSDARQVCIVLREGKNREVRRLFEHFGYEVRKLHRSRYGTITVRSLARGEYRHLTRQEVLSLRKLVGLS
jgi:23S rRNA pseudouridine2605 synthase